MAKLVMIIEGKEAIEVELTDISLSLNEIFERGVETYYSPASIPSIEHPQDKITGHFPAGSIVTVQKQDTSIFAVAQEAGFQDMYTTYSFKLVWDENYRPHDVDKHWNLRIYKSIHYRNGKPKITYYDLPDRIDHIKNTNEVTIKLLDDSNNEISSKTFYKETGY